VGLLLCVILFFPYDGSWWAVEKPSSPLLGLDDAPDHLPGVADGQERLEGKGDSAQLGVVAEFEADRLYEPPGSNQPSLCATSATGTAFRASAT